MARLGRWKSGLALLILLQILLHPAIHAHGTGVLLAASVGPTLERDDAGHPEYDVCTLCRIADSLHAPVLVPSDGHPLLRSDIAQPEAAAIPRAAERCTLIPRAPPAPVSL